LPTAAGWESELAEFTPLLPVSDLHYSRWKTVSEKPLTIFGANRFTRRGGTCRTTRDIYEPIVYQLGYQEELSSTMAWLPAISLSDCSVRSASGYARCPIIVLLGPRAWPMVQKCAPGVRMIAGVGRQCRYTGGAE
jgi:hypothetical protein